MELLIIFNNIVLSLILLIWISLVIHNFYADIQRHRQISESFIEYNKQLTLTNETNKRQRKLVDDYKKDHSNVITNDYKEDKDLITVYNALSKSEIKEDKDLLLMISQHLKSKGFTIDKVTKYTATNVITEYCLTNNK